MKTPTTSFRTRMSKKIARGDNRLLGTAPKNWRSFKQIYKKYIAGVRRTTHRLLIADFPQGLSRRVLEMQVANELGAVRYIDQIGSILRSLPSITFDARTGRYRARPGFLGRCDEFERLLRMERRPMHYKEIWAKSAGIRGGPKPTLNSVIPSLLYCPRFRGIGRSGWWILAEWQDCETGTVTDIAVDILKKAERAMTVKELFAAISKVRPVSLKSMRKLFSRDPRLVKVGHTTWNLAGRSARTAVARSKGSRVSR
jgi:hypothetical protein